MSLGMEKIGLSMPMGSFLAGVFLANSEVKKEIKALTLPFKGVLMGLFFMTLGIELEFSFLVNNIAKIGAICFIIILTKTLVLTLVTRIISGNYKSGLKVSLLISQSGEFGIVILGSALHLNVINSEYNKLFATSIVVTMILAPFIAKVLKFTKVSKDIPGDSATAQASLVAQDKRAA